MSAPNPFDTPNNPREQEIDRLSRRQQQLWEDARRLATQSPSTPTRRPYLGPPNVSTPPPKRRKRRTTPRQVPRRKPTPHPTSTQPAAAAAAPPPPPKHPQPTSNVTPRRECTTRQVPIPGRPTNRTSHDWAPPAAEIFQTHTPMLRHIPRRSREETCHAFTRTLWDCAMAEQPDRKHNAYLMLFMFPACILRALPSKQERHAAATNTRSPLNTVNGTIRSRIARWNAGEVQSLWHDALRHAQATASNRKPHTSSSPTAITNANLRRARLLAKEGALGKATQALHSRGIHKPTTEVLHKLQEKHPQITPTSDGPHEFSTTEEFELDPIPPIAPVDTAEILNAIRRFPRASAGGASGLSPAHLRELAHTTQAHDEGGFLNALAAVATELIRGTAPPLLSEWIAGAPLTALRKPNGDVRPIAVGESLRRMVSSIIIARHSNEIRDFLAPHQLGVSTRCGTEVVIHATRELTKRFGHRPDLAILQLDLRNTST